MFYDLALAYDPDQRKCDLVLADDCDLLIDETPVPAMLLSIGLDRRAAPDDPLPEGRTQFLAPVSFSERRGCAGDALDPAGQMTGSRLWLLDRAKATETTRQLTEYWLEEALSWAEPETGEPAEIEVGWLQTGATSILGYRAQVDDASLSLSRRVGA
ncbi:phage GP46 family protein [Rhizobium sp.]|uniref:phage GP46 family protein n=1 Tax=Rhizobium sp. TaxID=391 RepID=UPI003F80DE4F